MNSLFRNVKAINIPALKYLSRNLTPSLSTIENSRPIPNAQTAIESLRSKSLPPNLRPLPFDGTNPIDFHNKAISIDPQKLRKAELNKPTLKIICKFRRNFSQKSVGKAKKSQEKQIDRKKKQDVRDRLFQYPCIKPQNDSNKKTQRILEDQHDVKMKTSARNLHAISTSCSKSMSTFKDTFKNSPIKALLELNDEAQSKENSIKDIKAIQRKNKIKFHYLIENTECRQCVSKNKKRFADFFKKNEITMSKFAQKKRRYSTYTDGQSFKRFDPEQNKEKKEVVLVKDHNLTSELQNHAITLFNLVKLQSTRPRPNFVPTNLYKFDAKKISDKYQFLPEHDKDPYPLEMFNDELKPLAFDTAKEILPKKTSSYPFLNNDFRFIQPFSMDNIISQQSQLNKIFDLRANRNSLSLERKKCPCTKSEHNRCKIPKERKKDDDPCKKPKSEDPCKKRNPCNQPYKDLSSSIATVKEIPYAIHPLPSSGIYTTLELAKKKCPCRQGKKRAPCKIPVPKTDHDDDPCHTSTKKDPCHRDNPCSKIPQYKTMTFRMNEPVQINPATVEPLSGKYSWPDSSDRLSEKNDQKIINHSSFLEIFKARRNEYKDLLAGNKRPKSQPSKSSRSDYFFIPGQNSLDEKIKDCINIVPEIELGEKSKLMLAATIKKIIQPIIEKEFLKYEEVKAALERMEKHLALTLSTLKPLPSTPANQQRLNEKFPWKRINDVGIGEDTKPPAIKDPKEQRNNQQDPVRRIAVNVPKRNESIEEPGIDTLGLFAKVHRTYQKYKYMRSSKPKMEASSQKKCGNESDDACNKADELFKKGKKTDMFSNLSIKESVCEKEDPCETKDPCKKEDPCKKDPCEKSCSPCAIETVSKVDPCNSICKEEEEPPCFPPPKPPCLPVADPCDNGDLKGGVITCKKCGQEKLQPCRPKVSCNAESQGFARKDVTCKKCPETPELKQWPPCSAESVPSNSCDSKCPKDPSCDAKCPQVSCAECFQTPCKITKPAEEPLSVCSKKPTVECCVNKPKEHGFVGMKEAAKPDLTKNVPCPDCSEKAECKTSFEVTPPSPPKTDFTKKPVVEKFVPAPCKEEKCRYCDTSYLLNERKMKKLREEREAEIRRIKKSQCGKPVKFDPETRNRWIPVTIQPSKTADRKEIKQAVKKACDKKKFDKKLGASKSDSIVKSKKPESRKEKGLVETCSSKISDLCMMIIRKQKGGKKAAPIVVTLSRSQPSMGIFSELPIISSSSGSGNNGRKPNYEDHLPLKCNEQKRGTEETFLNLKETKSPNANDRNKLFCKKFMSEPTISCHAASLWKSKYIQAKRVSSDDLLRSVKKFSANANQSSSKKKSGPCKKQETPSKKKEEPSNKSGSQDPKIKELEDCLKKKRSKTDIQQIENKCDDPCKKKEDPCKKKEDPCKKKEDPCKKKEDPCKKKEDPCKKKEDPCKKKEDPCKKKEDPCKKQDPCKKKEDPCKKKEDPCKKKEDPCTKKAAASQDPKIKELNDCVKNLRSKVELQGIENKCADPCKKKEDPCKKKEDPCKKKEDPCKKKEDPCKKKEDPCKKKEDPCKKKEDPCKKKEDPCKKKEDPCKKKEDPCKKKEDPCKKKEDPCKKSCKGSKSAETIGAKSQQKDDPQFKRLEDCIKKLKSKEMILKDPIKGDSCKKDPCKRSKSAEGIGKEASSCDNKQKEDPCKKKEDPCKRSKSAETISAKSQSACAEVAKKASSCGNKQKDDPQFKRLVDCIKKLKSKEMILEDPIKGDSCKKDPCKRSKSAEGIAKKASSCDNKQKEDPCKKKPEARKLYEKQIKFKAASKNKKDDPCKKKEDSCKKKGDASQDPKMKELDDCLKKKRSKTDIQQIENTCDDPCKKKEDPCKKKEDPCKKKEDPCKKKEDPCKKKEDPCKKKEDPCKKKEDPCKKSCADQTKKPYECAKSGSKGDLSDDFCQKINSHPKAKGKFADCKAMLSIKPSNDKCCEGAMNKPIKTSKATKDIFGNKYPWAELTRRVKECSSRKSEKDAYKAKSDPCLSQRKPSPSKTTYSDTSIKSSAGRCEAAEKLLKKFNDENTCKPPPRVNKKLVSCKQKKEDPCKKKEDPCKKKEDPCKKKEDPCKKKEDPCKKKEDPCKKKEDPCKKKEDPCKKKEDPCKKKEDPCKKKEDPCKKKEDPCKKQDDPCKKKEPRKKKCARPDKKSRYPWNSDECLKKDICCKQKEDPCKKTEDISDKKSDPCIPCKYEDYSKRSNTVKESDPCGKQDDPCKKKEDPCKKKEDPCKKKEDPCKKKEDPCKKKEDPCKKKEDPCKKKDDPCKKKEDPCKKKEDPCKIKEDPCKKKEDPCKKKEDPCKKKEDPCKKKEDPCKKKEDPCKKKEDPCKKKEDPCKKKEDPCKKKEDPCKKKEDPCKKKEDPCKKKCVGLEIETQYMPDIFSDREIILPQCGLPTGENVRAHGRFNTFPLFDLDRQTTVIGICNPVISRPSPNMKTYLVHRLIHTSTNTWKLKSAGPIDDWNAKGTSKPSKIGMPRQNPPKLAPSCPKSACDLFPKRRKVDSTVSIIDYYKQKLKESAEEKNKCCREESASVTSDGALAMDQLRYSRPDSKAGVDEECSGNGGHDEALKKLKVCLQQKKSQQDDDTSRLKPMIECLETCGATRGCSDATLAEDTLKALAICLKNATKRSKEIDEFENNKKEEENKIVCKKAEENSVSSKCNKKDTTCYSEELSKQLLETMARLIQEHCRSSAKKNVATCDLTEESKAPTKEAENSDCVEKLNKAAPICPPESSCEEQQAQNTNASKCKALEETKTCKQDASNLRSGKESNEEILERMARKAQIYCKCSKIPRAKPPNNIKMARNSETNCKSSAENTSIMKCATTECAEKEEPTKLSSLEKLNREISARMERRAQEYCKQCMKKYEKPCEDKTEEIQCTENIVKNENLIPTCEEPSKIRNVCFKEHIKCIAEQEKSDKSCASEERLESAKVDDDECPTKHTHCAKEEDACEKNKIDASQSNEVSNKNLVCTQMQEVLNQLCKAREKNDCQTDIKPDSCCEVKPACDDSKPSTICATKILADPCECPPTKQVEADNAEEGVCEVKTTECEKIKDILSQPKTSLLCDDSKPSAICASKILAKQCECAPTQQAEADEEVCEETKQEPLKDQSMQKGLKDLTILVPGTEKTEVKDMGLLGQCMSAIKDRKYPETQPITDEEIDNTICKGPKIVCTVHKYGLGEKLVCREESSGDCHQEPDFDEDGVERILKCTVVRDKDNRTKYFCTPVLPKKLDGDRYEVDLKKHFKENYPEGPDRKVKVISNKLVCQKYPSADGSGNEEVSCALATVEEVKTVAKTCLKRKPAKKCKKKRQVLTYNDLMQKCRERHMKKVEENCKKIEEDSEEKKG